MSIRKRTWTTASGEKKVAWLATYSDLGGARRFKQFQRKRDAEEWLTNAKSEMLRGVHVPDSLSITVREAAQKWIARGVSAKLERTTIEDYEGECRRKIFPLIGDLKIARLTPPGVERFKLELIESAGLSGARRALNFLTMILEHCVRTGEISVNPARTIKVPKNRRKSKVIIPSIEEIRMLIQMAPTQWRPLLVLVSSTAIRSSEFRALPWSNVDLENGRITISQKADIYRVVAIPKSTAGSRSIPISMNVVNELISWKKICKPSAQNLVFPSRSGDVLSYSNLRRRMFVPLQRACALRWREQFSDTAILTNTAVGFRDSYGFHALRHFAASMWIKQNVDLKRLTTWMGHASVQITLDTYGHLMTDSERDAAIVSSVDKEVFGDGLSDTFDNPQC